MKKRPIVLCIMDGYGISESINGNAVRLANTPNLDDLMAMYPNTTISASWAFKYWSRKNCLSIINFN